MSSLRQKIEAILCGGSPKIGWIDPLGQLWLTPYHGMLSQTLKDETNIDIFEQGWVYVSINETSGWRMKDGLEPNQAQQETLKKAQAHDDMKDIYPKGHNDHRFDFENFSL